jgi:hypothetical protein
VVSNLSAQSAKLYHLGTTVVSRSSLTRVNKQQPYSLDASLIDLCKCYFLTNNFKLAAATIAQSYKARWQIELFIKWIKQNLKIKGFLRMSRNAVMTQIRIAICIIPATGLPQVFTRFNQRLQQILCLLQLNCLSVGTCRYCFLVIHHLKQNCYSHENSLDSSESLSFI